MSEELQRALAQKTKEVEVLQELAGQLSSTLELDRVLATILEAMDRVFGYAHAMVFLLEDGSEHLRLAASRGYEPPGIGAEIPIGQGIVGVAAKRKKILRMSGLNAQRRYIGAVREQMLAAGLAEGIVEKPALPGLPHVESEIAIPLLVGERLVGVFAVESTEMTVFEDKDEALIAGMASHAAAAINAARLYRQLAQLNDSLEDKVAARTLELKNTQARLLETQKMAALVRLVAGITHEMNSPLGALVSSTNTLDRAVTKLQGNEGPASPAVLGALSDSSRAIAHASGRIDSIVRRMKSFVRLDEALEQEVAIETCLEDALGLLRHRLEQITVVRDYGTTSPILCFPARLNDVFATILRNACDAVEEKKNEGQIVVRTRGCNTDGVFVEIDDNGVGMSEEEIEKIFDPAFSSRGPRVRMGLGLVIAYQVVHDHGGEIAFDSQIGYGTKVSIDLPSRVNP
jgi:signal transduction histidine kinase